MIYVRKVNKDDPEAAIAIEWLKNDEHHQSLGLTEKDLFDGEVALVYDEEGPIQAIRFQKALRAAVQFNPKTRLRNARAGVAVREWLRKLAADSGCSEVIVRPGGKAVRFVERLGFQEFNGKYIEVD